MAITNGYCTLEKLRVRVGAITGNYDKDNVLEDCIEAASRAIDRYTKRRFYADSENTTKYFTAVYPDVLFIHDDIVSIGTLGTDNDGDRTYENTWESTDYDLLPYNDAIKTMIEVTPNGNYNFPRTRKGVMIYGKFGISSVPEDIREACLLLASRYFKRKDAPFGVAGVNDFGTLQVLPTDSDVRGLLDPWVRII